MKSSKVVTSEFTIKVQKELPSASITRTHPATSALARADYVTWSALSLARVPTSEMRRSKAHIVTTLTLTQYPSRDPQMKTQTYEIRRSRWPKTAEEDKMAKHKLSLSLPYQAIIIHTTRVINYDSVRVNNLSIIKFRKSHNTRC